MPQVVHSLRVIPSLINVVIIIILLFIVVRIVRKMSEKEEGKAKAMEQKIRFSQSEEVKEE